MKKGLLFFLFAILSLVIITSVIIVLVVPISAISNDFCRVFLGISLCLFLIVLSFILCYLFLILMGKIATKSAIKEFCLEENSYLEISACFKDNFENRKKLIQIIETLKEESDANSILLENGSFVNFIFQLNAEKSMTDLLIEIIHSIGGKFYLFLHKNKVFFCIKADTGKIIYQSDIAKESDLNFYIED